MGSRAGARRSGVGDRQGRPGDWRGRCGGLSQRPTRSQHRPRHRRTVSAARSARGAPGLPGDHRGHESSRRLRRCARRLLRRRDRAHRHAPGRRAQRGAARRRRPVVLQLLHASAHPADAAVQRRHRARCDVGERRVGGRGHTAGGRRPGVVGAAGHAAGRRADPPAGRRRRGRGGQAGPFVSQCAGGAFGVRPTRRRVLRGAGQHRRPTGIAGRRRRRDQRAVLLAGHVAGRAASCVADRHRRSGGPGARRQRLDDTAEPA
ncbi:Uncharacterised protein [Mycobacterium tuberculosis]|nr:Uncharacterised protein [Mycobacterium tuberculosis]CNV46885.1 Uncharacterised protein [Mycobacterium tuberculosis]CNX01881.1 Uncharacterised protein [Mycobacterium tuberculosis]CNX19170.1 Uncharacterised protein [Mycobacterium tuberculosis]CNX39622.1 Uncharacterised protein [Mycobacterium tuberculosis]